MYCQHFIICVWPRNNVENRDFTLYSSSQWPTPLQLKLRFFLCVKTLVFLDVNQLFALFFAIICYRKFSQCFIGRAKTCTCHKIELFILFDSTTNDKKFYNLKNPRSLHIHHVKKVSFKRQLFSFSTDTYSVSFVSLTYCLADFSGLVFLYNQKLILATWKPLYSKRKSVSAISFSHCPFCFNIIILHLSVIGNPFIIQKCSCPTLFPGFSPTRRCRARIRERPWLRLVSCLPGLDTNFSTY